MKKDIEDMILIIEGKLNDFISDSSLYGNIIKEIIELLKKTPVEDGLELETLNELYIFMKVGLTRMSIDPRGDWTTKSNALYDINDAIENNTLSKDKIDSLKRINELCLTNFLNPLKLNKELERFHNEHPGVKF